MDRGVPATPRGPISMRCRHARGKSKLSLCVGAGAWSPRAQTLKSPEFESPEPRLKFQSTDTQNPDSRDKAVQVGVSQTVWTLHATSAHVFLLLWHPCPSCGELLVSTCGCTVVSGRFEWPWWSTVAWFRSDVSADLVSVLFFWVGMLSLVCVWVCAHSLVTALANTH